MGKDRYVAREDHEEDRRGDDWMDPKERARTAREAGFPDEVRDGVLRHIHYAGDSADAQIARGIWGSGPDDILPPNARSTTTSRTRQNRASDRRPERGARYQGSLRSCTIEVRWRDIGITDRRIAEECGEEIRRSIRVFLIKTANLSREYAVPDVRSSDSDLCHSKVRFVTSPGTAGDLRSWTINAARRIAGKHVLGARGGGILLARAETAVPLNLVRGAVEVRINPDEF